MKFFCQFLIVIVALFFVAFLIDNAVKLTGPTSYDVVTVEKTWLNYSRYGTSYKAEISSPEVGYLSVSASPDIWGSLKSEQKYRIGYKGKYDCLTGIYIVEASPVE